MTKVVRTQEVRYKMSADIASVIPTGHGKKVSISKIVSALSSYQEGKSAEAFKKEVERFCQKMHEERYDEDDGLGLVRLAKKGTQTYYYWSDKEERERSVEFFTITRPRALALFLVKEHVSEMLPSSFFNALSSDFKIAEEKLKSDGIQLSDILEYSPFGLNMVKTNSESSQKKEATFNLVFEAILSRSVIKIEYRSIHEEYATQAMYISGQKLRYLNNQLQLLGYEHNSGSTKHFTLSKISTIELAPQIPFVNLDPEKYESKHTLKMRCHTWVKDTFDSSRIGGHLITKDLGLNVWEVSDDVTFPLHFNGNRPDGFYIANFLSMFADSVEVLAPDFLRREMQRRSAAMNTLYAKGNSTSNEDRKAIVSDSPEKIAKLK